MRRRSCAFHAETQEEYIKIAVDDRNQESYFYNNSSKKSSLSVLSRSLARKAEIESSDWLQDEFAYSVPDSDSTFEQNDEADKQEEVDNYFKVATKRNSRSSLNSINSPTTFSIELGEDSAIMAEFQQQIAFVQEKHDFMLIGAVNTGKHALINSQFPNSTESDSDSLMKRLDLVVRKTSTYTSETTYNFWIKELISDAYERLIQLYYKKCSVFVFVYDITSRDSFEKLETEIANVKQSVGEGSFVGLLVATKSDKLDERAVNYEEGAALKLKYNLKYFNETNVQVEKETQQLLRKIRSFSKLKAL